MAGDRLPRSRLPVTVTDGTNRLMGAILPGSSGPDARCWRRHVIYHLTEDAVFEAYLTHLFAAATKYVNIYATNAKRHGTAPHVRHRHFTPWMQTHCTEWSLLQVTPGRTLVPTAPTSSQLASAAAERRAEMRPREAMCGGRR
jgi:hypothetical protein